MRIDALLGGRQHLQALLPAHQVVAHAEGGIDVVEAIGVGHGLDPPHADQRIVAQLFQGAGVEAALAFVQGLHQHRTEQDDAEQAEELTADAELFAQGEHVAQCLVSRQRWMAAGSSSPATGRDIRWPCA